MRPDYLGSNRSCGAWARDHDAAVAGLTLPYTNGPCEGANTISEATERQMYGRAGFSAPSASNPVGVEQNPTPPDMHQSQISDSPQDCRVVDGVGDPFGFRRFRVVSRRAA